MKDKVDSYLNSLEEFSVEIKKRNFTDEEKKIIFKVFSEYSLKILKGTFENIVVTNDIPSTKIIDRPKTSKDENFANLVRKTKFKQHTDLVLLAAYYLMLIKGFESFTINEIEIEYSNAMLKTSINTHANVNVNRKKGYIMESGKKENKMAFKITMSGIDYIDNILNNE